MVDGSIECLFVFTLGSSEYQMSFIDISVPVSQFHELLCCGRMKICMLESIFLHSIMLLTAEGTLQIVLLFAHQLQSSGSRLVNTIQAAQLFPDEKIICDENIKQQKIELIFHLNCSY